MQRIFKSLQQVLIFNPVHKQTVLVVSAELNFGVIFFPNLSYTSLRYVILSCYWSYTGSLGNVSAAGNRHLSYLVAGGLIDLVYHRSSLRAQLLVADALQINPCFGNGWCHRIIACVQNQYG